MEYLTTTEYATLHGVSQVAVRKKILRGLLPAEKKGKTWLIRKDEPYVDNRIKSGAYVDWRKKSKQTVLCEARHD